MVNNVQDLVVAIHAPGSMARIEFQTPPYHSTFKRGGGGPESGVHLSNGPYQHARINGDKDHSGPPLPFYL
jgi:hypothetical protein